MRCIHLTFTHIIIDIYVQLGEMCVISITCRLFGRHTGYWRLGTNNWHTFLLLCKPGRWTRITGVKQFIYFTGLPWYLQSIGSCALQCLFECLSPSMKYPRCHWLMHSAYWALFQQTTAQVPTQCSSLNVMPFELRNLLACCIRPGIKGSHSGYANLPTSHISVGLAQQWKI